MKIRSLKFLNMVKRITNIGNYRQKSAKFTYFWITNVPLKYY